jgi:hypothetical protein
MLEKKGHRVSMFLGDRDYDRFLADAYDSSRSPADFMRWLWSEHRRTKVREWAANCQRDQVALDGSDDLDSEFGERVAPRGRG